MNVDIATYKAEFLSHYWEGRVRPRYAYAFGLIDRWARLASIWPGDINLVDPDSWSESSRQAGCGHAAGPHDSRICPANISQLVYEEEAAISGAKGKVILWPDTFNNYFFPETAQAATEVIERAGFSVEIPRNHLCCGRPLYDYGMLDAAKLYLSRVMQALRPQIEAGLPIVVLEPSCASVFRDELKNLFPDDPLAHKLKAQTLLLSEFLETKAGSTTSCRNCTAKRWYRAIATTNPCCDLKPRAPF